jgi:hypothetical protein
MRYQDIIVFVRRKSTVALRRRYAKNLGARATQMTWRATSMCAAQYCQPAAIPDIVARSRSLRLAVDHDNLHLLNEIAGVIARWLHNEKIDGLGTRNDDQQEENSRH